MTLDEFEKITAKTARSLPPEFRARLDNVIIIVKTAPAAGQARRFAGGLLGLYEGVPLADRGTSYSGAMPDKITLFKNNIEAGCADAGEIAGRIRHTLLHEIAHHFGITDKELRDKGLY